MNHKGTKNYQIIHSYTTSGLKSAFIDLDKNNGQGVVVQKEIPIFTDAMQAHLATACRHANGRDWWIITIKSGMGKYYKTLLNPNGFVPQLPQTMPYINGSERKSSVAYFSPNGKMYAHYNGEQGAWLYDFDRCTGMLYNRRLIPLFRAFRTGYAGLAFSPNSRYLYMNDDSQIAQYDLEAADVPASKIIVAEYDGFADTIGFARFNTSFFLMQLAPNGKIYGNCTGGNRYLHVIHNPNEQPHPDPPRRGGRRADAIAG